MQPSADRSMWPTRLGRLSDQEDDSDILSLSPAERIEMMWPLAVNAWAFMGVDVRGLQFQRNVARVIRGPKSSPAISESEVEE